MMRENFTAMSNEQLARELVLEVQRDPWVLDWPEDHRGRQIRDEQEQRRLRAERIRGTLEDRTRRL